MTFISYSQNCEDVLLHRALGHVAKGFYIDIGANDPVEHSVTKAFYDIGWRGINVEPLPLHIAAFNEQRLEDINLAVAAGAADGELTLYDVPAVRGWASNDPAIADLHRIEGHQVSELTVPVRTLASICEQYVTGEIHFLKIDVEGFEGEVLRGMDFKRWRPWVLVVEATLPNSRATNHDQWEHLITGERYRFAWFDGLNRYYVAEEHAELAAQLDIQPNVFDNYISYHLDLAWKAERTLTEALNNTDAHARGLEQRLSQAGEVQERLSGELHRIDTQAQILLAQLEEARARIGHEVQRADDAYRRADYAHGRADRAIEALSQAEAALAPAKAQLVQMQEQFKPMQAWALDMQSRLQAIEASSSWRLTAPLRLVGGWLRSVPRPNLRPLLRQTVRPLVTRVTQNEWLRRTLIPLLLRHPALGRRVSTLLAKIKGVPAADIEPGLSPEQQALRALPVSVRTALADLQRARQSHPEH